MAKLQSLRVWRALRPFTNRITIFAPHFAEQRNKETEKVYHIVTIFKAIDRLWIISFHWSTVLKVLSMIWGWHICDWVLLGRSVPTKNYLGISIGVQNSTVPDGREGSFCCGLVSSPKCAVPYAERLRHLHTVLMKISKPHVRKPRTKLNFHRNPDRFCSHLCLVSFGWKVNCKIFLKNQE